MHKQDPVRVTGEYGWGTATPPLPKRCFLAVPGDCHLFEEENRAWALSRCLSSFAMDNLVFNGDFLHTDDLDEILRVNSPAQRAALRVIKGKAEEGTIVYVISGNHDAGIRHLIAKATEQLLEIGNSKKVKKEALELLVGMRDWCIDERFFLIDIPRTDLRYLITHGDQWDYFTESKKKWNKFITRLGSHAYTKLKKWDTKGSVTKKAKKRLKTWMKVIDAVEEGSAKYAHRLGATHVITGHTHDAKAASVKVLDKTIVALNAGSAESYESSLITVSASGKWTIHKLTFKKEPKE